MRLAPALLLCPILAATPAAPTWADDPEARRIMEAVDARDDGRTSTSRLEMILIDKNGHERVRRLRSYTRDWGETGEDSQQILFFESPADVQDTGFLTYDYDAAERDDDQWLYLPALRKTKRIASSDKSGSFMGSDFSYADMTERALEDYDYQLMKETEVHGHKAWQIEAKPRNTKEIEETGYKRSILFVRQDNHVIVRAVHWLQDGDRLKYLDVKRLEQIDGIWTPLEVQMTTKRGRETLHQTVLRSHDVRYNEDLADDLFSVRRLEKGS